MTICAKRLPSFYLILPDVMMAIIIIIQLFSLGIISLYEEVTGMNKIGNMDGSNMLFLQGSVGNFFKRVDLVFRKRGARTFKIGFNAGDQFFSNGDNYTPYRSTKEEWKEFIYDFLIKHKIDKVFLFGDCRFYQSITIGEARSLNIDIFVFEEGYIRPDFITMERYGVNDFSHIPRDRSFYEALDITQFDEKEIHAVNTRHHNMILSAAAYYLLADLFRHNYPHYDHHRKLNFVNEVFFAARNASRKFKYKLTERGLLEKLLYEHKDNYYFVPLQTYSDFQIKEHSHFSSIEEFIKTVMHSFAKFAPQKTQLVIKHHPVDRGRKDYTEYINALSKKFDIGNRALSVHDLHLPSCLKNAVGTITINSTVGISSLYHHTPTIVLGNAIYDIDGLTCKDMQLDDFWKGYKAPNKELFEKFRRYLIDQTQLNGSFYGRFPTELKDN